MLSLAIFFIVAALLAAVLGFGGVAGSFAWLAKLFFIGFLALALVSFAMRAVRGESVA